MPKPITVQTLASMRDVRPFALPRPVPPVSLTLEEQAVIGADGDDEQQAEQIEHRQQMAVARQQQRRGCRSPEAASGRQTAAMRRTERRWLTDSSATMTTQPMSDRNNASRR